MCGRGEMNMDEAMYEALLECGFQPEEIDDPYYIYTDYTLVPPQKTEIWQVVLGLAMMFLCMALTIGGL